jgi:general stress protein YciG
VEKVKQKRGFAAMSPEKRRAIASLGGKSVPADKRAFALDPDLAKSAAHKGGGAVPPEKRGFAADPSLAAEAGRRGGSSPRKLRHATARPAEAAPKPKRKAEPR